MSRVLIVDDKEENLYYLQMLLSGNGFQVETARHGAEALVKARQNPPGIIVSDLLMPVMDGYTLLRHWKADEDFRTIPFVVYTATYTEAEDEQLALNLGADAFVLKPSEPEEFLARLNDVLSVSASGGKPGPKHSGGDEKVLLKYYSETLIRKLEEKTLQLEEANRRLQQDITERKQAEEERDRLFNLSGDLLCVANFDGRLEQVNPAWTRCLGWSAEELTGRPSVDFVHPGDRESTLRARLDLTEGQPVQIENRYLCKDGSVRWLSWSSHPLPETRQVFAVAKDITERKLAEISLRESEQRFRQLAENINEVFWLTDHAKEQFLYVSPAFEKIWGRGCQELYETPEIWLEAVHPDDRERVAAATATQAQGEYDEVYRIVRPDGSLRWIRDRAFPVANRLGLRYRVVGTAQDITERKLAEDELARSNRALQMRSVCSKAITRSSEEKPLLTDICRLAVEIGGYQMAWVGYAHEDEAKSIVPMAHAGREEGYLSAIKLNWAGKDKISQGPAGQTIRKGQAVVCKDITADRANFYWSDEALARGYRSVICLPLRDANRTFGLLALLSNQVNEAGDDELKLLQELADDLAFGIVNIHAQNERKRLQVAVTKVAANVSASSNDGFFVQVAANMAEALGAQAGFISRLLPGKSPDARTIAVVTDGKESPNFDFSVKGTPCAALANAEDCVIPANVALLYPKSPLLAELGAQAYVGRRLMDSQGRQIGMLFVLFREPLKVSDFISSTLQIFATRVAAEMERQKADVRLRDQASLLDKAQDAIIVRDLDHRILFWNRSAERLYGWTRAQAVGSSIKELLYTDPEAFVAATQTVVEKGEWVGEIEQLTREGLVKVVEGRWSLVHDEMGLPKSILAINTDITERKKLEQQFLRAQRIESIGTLAGGIAHDLNNVLAPILMSIELLRTYIDDSNGIEILEMVGTSARRGADMVSQVLSFARGVEGREMEVPISSIVRDLVRIVSETFQKNIEIEADIDPALWFVKGDPTQIHQVLLNLCVNARDAMPEGGHILLKAQNLIIDEHYAGMNIEAVPGPYIKIEVEDSGHGIPTENIDKLFDPFFTTKEVGKGTGLGLSTSLAIVKSHGGFIRAYSDPGMGARFRVYLPALTDVIPVEHEEPSKTELPRGQGETVLVVDDEASIRQITSQTLEAFGYQVLLAADGSEAISVYVKHQDRIDVVLTDMMMPIMDGPATIQVLRRLNPALRIIAASGISANGKVAKATNSGIRDFLPKPYTAETLLKAIRRALTDDPM